MANPPKNVSVVHIRPDGRTYVTDGRVLPTSHVNAPMPAVKPPRTEGSTSSGTNQPQGQPEKDSS